MRVAVIVSGDVRFDGRVRRESASLKREHEVYTIDQGCYSPSLWDRGKYIARATRRLLKLKPDVIHANDLDTLPAAIVAKKRTGARLVWDCHEIFYDMVRDGPHRNLSTFFRKVEPLLAECADAVIAANDGVAGHLRGIGLKPCVIRNYPPRPCGEFASPNGGPLEVVYIGTLQAGRMISEAEAVAQHLDGVRMTVHGLKGNHGAGPVPQDGVIRRMREAHVVLAMCDPSRLQNREGMPNKVYEAMAAGRPSLVSAHTRAADEVERRACGWALDYDPTFLSLGLKALRDHPDIVEGLGRNGFDAAKRECNWESEEKRLLKIYEGLA